MMRLNRLGLAALAFSLYSEQASAQGACDHYLDDDCIDAYGETTFDFNPIFDEPVTFAYGFRVYFNDEISSSLIGTPSGYNGDVNRLKAWLSYDNSTVNIDRSANRSSDVAVLFTNTSGTVGGGNNGCDGLLGKECAANLIDILKWSVIHADDYPLTTFSTVDKFRETPLTNLSCPTGIFEEAYSMTGLTGSGLLSEYEHTFENSIGYRSLPRESGNASYPWTNELMWMSAEEQMSWAAVGIATRFPSTRPRNYDDIDLRLVCVRPEPVEHSGERIDVDAIPSNDNGEDSGDGDGDGGGDDDAAPGLQVVWLLLGAMTMAATFVPAL